MACSRCGKSGMDCDCSLVIAMMPKQAQQAEPVVCIAGLGDTVPATPDSEGRWLRWSGGNYPDDSCGKVIAAYADGICVLDDGLNIWNPMRALAFVAAGGRLAVDAVSPNDKSSDPREGGCA